jgi:copper(I)-binding protein
MRGISRRALLGAAAGLSCAPLAAAQQAAPVSVTAPWTRAAGAGGNGAGFMAIRNTGSTPDRLLEARAAIARTVELHTHIRDGDVMRMRPVQAIDLPPGQTVTLQPGGLHVMLIGLNAPLRQGEEIPVTLVFERAGTVQVALKVEGAGARGPAMQGHRH